MSYSSVDDLLIGDMSISGNINQQMFVDSAAEEIDSKIGFVYILPLEPLPGLSAIPSHEMLLLKQINNKLASGELIMALAVGGEDSTVHAYGMRLVTEAKMELMLIANMGVRLSAVELNPATVTGETTNRVPSIVNHDEESAVEQFENNTIRGQHSYWRPGKIEPQGGPNRLQYPFG